MKANPGVQCGNPLHPDGPWHTASPIPPTWERRERLRQWWRKRRYGCGCAVVADVTALLDAYDSVTAALAAAEQRADTAAALVESMCHWRFDPHDMRAPGDQHDAFHFGDKPGQTGVCPYEAMAAVLRGEPDPRLAALSSRPAQPESEQR